MQTWHSVWAIIGMVSTNTQTMYIYILGILKCVLLQLFVRVHPERLSLSLLSVNQTVVCLTQSSNMRWRQFGAQPFFICACAVGYKQVARMRAVDSPRREFWEISALVLPCSLGSLKRKVLGGKQEHYGEYITRAQHLPTMHRNADVWGGLTKHVTKKAE